MKAVLKTKCTVAEILSQTWEKLKTTFCRDIHSYQMFNSGGRKTSGNINGCKHENTFPFQIFKEKTEMHTWMKQFVQMSGIQVSRGIDFLFFLSACDHYSSGKCSEQSVRSKVGRLPCNLKSAAASQHRAFLTGSIHILHSSGKIIHLLLNVFPLAEVHKSPSPTLSS